MPMMEFRYDEKKISNKQAAAIGEGLESALRNAIAALGRQKKDYGVTVEGDAFGPIAHGQPDLRIYVFYHDDWNFTTQELTNLPHEIKTEVELLLKHLKIRNITAKIRCYGRSGPPSASIAQ